MSRRAVVYVHGCRRRVVGIITVAILASSPIALAAGNVQQENQQRGTRSWRIRRPAMAHEIEGYADRVSVVAGDTLHIFVNTTSPVFSFRVFRVGWYDGRGARAVTPRILATGRLQPACSTFSNQCASCPSACAQFPVTCPVECAWDDPITLAIGADWVSGVYLVKLRASGRESYVLFVVREDARPAPYLVKIPVDTYQAYNNWGGYSLYRWNSVGGAYATTVSFDRPYGDYVGQGFVVQPDPAIGAGSLFEWDINFIRWLEREGYDATYATDVDFHENPAILAGRRAYLGIGHDEYWSGAMFSSLLGARNAGVNLGFFSANEFFYQVQFLPSAAGVPDRVMYNSRQLYRDQLASFGNETHASLVGLIPSPGSGVDTDIVVMNVSHPDASWIFAGTGLHDGDHLPGLLGYEVDVFAEPTADPYQQRHVQLASSPIAGVALTAGMSVYEITGDENRVATVFATGSMEWAWGLDSYSPRLPGLEAGVLTGVFEEVGAAPTWTDKVRAPSGASRMSAAAQGITRNVLARFAQ